MEKSQHLLHQGVLDADGVGALREGGAQRGDVLHGDLVHVLQAQKKKQNTRQTSGLCSASRAAGSAEQRSGAHRAEDEGRGLKALLDVFEDLLLLSDALSHVHRLHPHPGPQPHAACRVKRSVHSNTAGRKDRPYSPPQSVF